MRHLRAAAGLIFVVLLSLPEGFAAFDLQVEILNGDTQLDFGQQESLDRDGRSIERVETQQVRLRVVTDLGRRYRIFQVFNGELHTPEQDQMPPGALRFFVTQTQGIGGVVHVLSSKPIQVGEEEIFLSESVGSEVELLIRYDFLVPPGQTAGNYQSAITYRLITDG